MAAFRRAVDLGAEWVELDVRTSKDGVFYVLHDPWVDRVTDGKGLLRDMTSQEIDRLDAGVKFDPKFRGERVPRLRDVLVWIHGKAKVNLDVKDADPVKLIRLIYETKMQDDVFMWFGNPFEAAAFMRYDKRLPQKVNVGNIRQLEDAKRQFNASLVETGLQVATPEFMRRADELGIGVIIACDSSDPEAFRPIFRTGARFVMLNHPLAFLAARQAEEAPQASSLQAQGAGKMPALHANASLRQETMTQARKKAAHRKRRIIVNNDGNDCRNPKPGEPRTPENFLSKRTSPLVGSHVDAVFYCTGVFNSYTQKSDETETRGHGDRRAVDWAHELIQIGRDSLRIMVDFGHQQHWEVFWSMRMNDTHDSADEALLCQWKKDHPQYLMGTKADKFPYGGRRWSAVNYGIPEVREKVFRILQDVATRYDVDGIELDFFRHPVYFKPQMTGDPVTQEHCDMMTDLLRRVRKMADEVGAGRGRPMLIAVRVPDSVGYAKAIGLDLVKWLEEDLIDLMTGTCYFHLEPWENMVALCKRYDVPFYACLSASRLVSPKEPESKGDIEAWRGEALRAWQAGVSGIYTFNRFNPRDPIFRELGNPELLKTLKWTYKFNPGQSMDAWLKDGKRFLTPEK
jgi:hypothetical protein